jgi:hypothetical protein
LVQAGKNMAVIFHDAGTISSIEQRE